MAKRTEIVYFEDVLDCIDKIENYIDGISESDFEANFEKQDAVIRRIEIIGEAVKNISIETRNKNPEVPWREIAGMRDMVVYAYFGVSIGMIWKVAKEDIPRLKLDLIRIKKELQG